MNQNTTTNWDLIIRPTSGWLDLHLSDLWRYRDLTMLFVWRDFVAQYKQTILGPLWYLIQPLFSTIVFTIVFGRVAKIPTDGLPPFLFYMAGVTCWSYFAECLTRTSGTFITNAGLFGKVYFPRLTVPLSIVISNILKFGIQFLFFIGFLAYFMINGAPIRPNYWIFLMPYLLLLMAGLGLGAGIIISALTTKYRDLQQLLFIPSPDPMSMKVLCSTPIAAKMYSSIPSSSNWEYTLKPVSDNGNRHP